jgi:nitronate monooxygenase
MSNRLTELLAIDSPVIQAPMAGSSGRALAVAVSEAGGLGSLPCVMLGLADIKVEVAAIREQTPKPFNLNFFCHRQPDPDPAQLAAWVERLAPYFAELDVAAPAAPQAGGRQPFDEATCELIEELRPPVVSFHFGLPPNAILARVKATGATILSSATTVAEAQWLVDHGCDVVIAQGVEAGGHRGMFLIDDPGRQVGTMALVPQVVDAVDVPVVAAGGIADGRGLAAALALGASGVQVGTAFLRCPEAMTTAPHRGALAAATDDSTTLTNVVTGRPARAIVNRLIAEVGPMSRDAPPFPLANIATAALRAAAEQRGSTDFSPLWAGQAAALCSDVPAGDLVRSLVDSAQECLRRIGANAS